MSRTVGKKKEYIVRLDQKFMTLEMMAKVYSTLPKLQVEEEKKDEPQKKKSKPKEKKKGGFFSFIFNPFKKKVVEEEVKEAPVVSDRAQILLD